MPEKHRYLVFSRIPEECTQCVDPDELIRATRHIVDTVRKSLVLPADCIIHANTTVLAIESAASSFSPSIQQHYKDIIQLVIRGLRKNAEKF